MIGRVIPHVARTLTHACVFTESAVRGSTCCFKQTVHVSITSVLNLGATKGVSHTMNA